MTMRQRRSRFNRAMRVITIRAPMGLVEILNAMPPAEISRALRVALKLRPYPHMPAYIPLRASQAKEGGGDV